MDDPLHIIITGDRGKIFNILCSRRKLKTTVVISVISVFFLFCTSIFSLSLFTENHKISNKLLALQEKLDTNEAYLAKHGVLSKQQQFELDQKVAQLSQANKEMAAKFKAEKAEKEELLATAVDELNERNEIIEKIFGSIGIKLPRQVKESSKNSGGPFIKDRNTDKDALLLKADSLIESINTLPLGKPISGRITSRFGKRTDPVNGKKGFHTGLDIRGKRGQKIYATADGIVKRALRFGGYGNFVLIDHGNGYKTSFAHMQAFKVRKGDRIERGQVIGLVGNTGRSTGPHLHYEILINNKQVNPYNFMKTKKFTELALSSAETK